MKILLIKPQEKPEAVEISGTLEVMQQIVGGAIQAIYPFREEVAIVCNDEGKLLGLPLNRALRDNSGHIYDIISGTFFICAAPSNSENFESLSEEQIERYTRIFRQPELFLRLDGKVACIPMDE